MTVTVSTYIGIDDGECPQCGERDTIGVTLVYSPLMATDQVYIECGNCEALTPIESFIAHMIGILAEAGADRGIS